MRALVVVLVLCAAAHAIDEVEEYLKTLTKQQAEDGSWGDPQLTARVLLAYLSAGEHGRGKGPHAKAVRKGLNSLIASQKQSFPVGARGQAMVALVLCEAWGMTRNPRYKRRAQDALDRLEKSDDAVTAAWVSAAVKSGTWGNLRVDLKLVQRDMGTNTASERAGALMVKALFEDAGKLTAEAAEVARMRDKLDLDGEIFLNIAMFRVGGKPWRDWIRGTPKRRPRSIHDTASHTIVLGLQHRWDRVICCR